MRQVMIIFGMIQKLVREALKTPKDQLDSVTGFVNSLTLLIFSISCLLAILLLS